MQEEVEGRTVNLAISTSKLTARTIVIAVRSYMNHRKSAAVKGPEGKQSVKDLIGQGQGVTNIDISKTDLKGFEKVARKYGIDYAIRKDASVEPPKYLVFFKAKDADAMTAAFNEYSQRALKRGDCSRVQEPIRNQKPQSATLPACSVKKKKQREHSR